MKCTAAARSVSVLSERRTNRMSRVMILRRRRRNEQTEAAFASLFALLVRLYFAPQPE